MKEAFDKIIERLETEVEYQSSKADQAGKTCAFEEITVVKAREKMAECYEHAIEIVKEVAEEFGKDTNVRTNDDWIPFNSYNLPNKGQKVWLSFTNEITSYVKHAWWVGTHFEWDNSRRVKETPIAWKPYDVPAPYQPKGV